MGEKGGLRRPVVVGAEEEGGPVPSRGGKALPEVQGGHSLLLQHREDLVGVVIAVVRDPLRQAVVPRLELLGGLDIEQGDVPVLQGQG